MTTISSLPLWLQLPSVPSSPGTQECAKDGITSAKLMPSAEWMPPSLIWPVPTWISSCRCAGAPASVEESEGDPAERTLGSWRLKTWLRLTPSAKGWQPLAPWWLETLCLILLFSFVTALVCS